MGILFQGTVTYNGRDIAYSIAEMEDKKVQVTISFLIGSNKNEATFKFNKVKENHWSLDRNETKSEIDIDLKFDKENNRWVLGTDNLMGCGNIQLVYRNGKYVYEYEEEPELVIERNGVEVENITKTDCVSINEKKNTIDVNLDGLIETLSEERGAVGKFIISPIVKGLCDDLVRTYTEQAEKQTGSKVKIEKDVIEEKLAKKITSKNKPSADKKKVARKRSSTTSVTRGM